MPQIVIENLVKRFRISERDAGIWGAIRGMAHRRYRTVDALDGGEFLDRARRVSRIHRA